MTDQSNSTRWWLYPLLFLSLAINLLIVGIVVGWMASPGGPGRADDRSARGLLGEPFVKALPNDQKRALLRDMGREARSIRESRETLRARLEAFLQALRADPFDPLAVQALMREQRSAALRRQDIGEKLLLDRLSEMTPEQRDAYAAALEQSFRRLRRTAD